MNQKYLESVAEKVVSDLEANKTSPDGPLIAILAVLNRIEVLLTQILNKPDPT